MSQGVRTVHVEESVESREYKAPKKRLRIKVAEEKISASPPRSNGAHKKREVTLLSPERKREKEDPPHSARVVVPDLDTIPDFPLKRREPAFSPERRAGSKRRHDEIGEERRVARPGPASIEAPPDAKRRRRDDETSQYRYDSGYGTRANDRYRRSYSLTHQSDRRGGNMGPRVHFLPMKGEIFLRAIKEGTKKFEGRVHATQCQRMQVGDQLKLFDNRARWGILCEIVSKDVYPDFEPMLKAKGILALLPQLKEESKRLPPAELMRRAVAIYRNFPGSQRVQRLGAAAIGVKWIKDI